ncbi:signal peptidase II [Pacificimonas flava]|uniref:Lipoprotein signal peptidase n=2 Tax=Pacificimonas TaxID=1960290 RepID=A0A219B125_9SPHN|nr:MULTISPECIES: signal peptidase II [Pacificimonas]MBZ6380062.1 signal peptidase II [Pacificimonas aurantium]OWV32031.1 signal peptidase II [Pacificimonas flava]
MTARVAYVVALLIFVVDQVTKWLIVDVVRLHEVGSIPLIPVLSLTWVENTGVAMGFLQAGDADIMRWGLVILTLGIAAAIVWWIDSERDRVDLFAMSLILGGALGNILDRARLGYVIDFVHFHVGDWSFYVFNVADAAISIGVVILLLRAFLWHEPQKRRKAEATGELK